MTDLNECTRINRVHSIVTYRYARGENVSNDLEGFFLIFPPFSLSRFLSPYLFFVVVTVSCIIQVSALNPVGSRLNKREDEQQK